MSRPSHPHASSARRSNTEVDIDPSTGIPYSWAFDAVNAGPAIAAVGGGSSFPVGIIDTGVDTSEPDLAGRIATLRHDASGGEDVTDKVGHGTMVAGVIAMVAGNGIGGRGIAGATQIVPIRVSTTGLFFSDAVAQSIVWAVDHGVRVVNMSLGGTELVSPALSRAMAYAVRSRHAARRGCRQQRRGRRRALVPRRPAGSAERRLEPWPLGRGDATGRKRGVLLVAQRRRVGRGTGRRGGRGRHRRRELPGRSVLDPPERGDAHVRGRPGELRHPLRTAERSGRRSLRLRARARASRRRSSRRSPRSSSRPIPHCTPIRSPTSSVAARTRPSAPAGTSTREQVSSTRSRPSISRAPTTPSPRPSRSASYRRARRWSRRSTGSIRRGLDRCSQGPASRRSGCRPTARRSARSSRRSPLRCGLPLPSSPGPVSGSAARRATWRTTARVGTPARSPEGRLRPP